MTGTIWPSVWKDPAKTTPLIVEALAALEELGKVERANDGYRMAG
jgi:hypothetical protein